MLTQYFLNFTWVDVEAAGDNDFLDAGDQADEAVFFHDAHVTGAEPAVVEGGFGGLRVVEVALEHLVAACEDLALDAVRLGLIQVVRVRNAHLGVREWDSHVARAAVCAHRVTHDDGGALGQAVALNQQAAGVFFPLLYGVHRQGRGAGECRTHALDVDVLFLSRLDDALVEGWHTWNPRRSVLLHQVHDERNVRLWNDDQLAADKWLQDHVHNQAISVKEGQRAEHALRLVAQARNPVLALQNDGEEVAV